MAWRRPATETLFIGLAQPQSGVGWVGMGLWPVHAGAQRHTKTKKNVPSGTFQKTIRCFDPSISLLLNTLAQNCFVELAGVEPASKQGISKFSTCLADS